MSLFSQEHYDLMANFERLAASGMRLDREDKALWAKGHIYQSGETNTAFNFYRRGYAAGQCDARLDA